MSRRIQILWAAALYVTFAAVAVGHINAGDWGYLFTVTTLAVAASAAFTVVLRVRRSQLGTGRSYRRSRLGPLGAESLRPRSGRGAREGSTASRRGS